MKAQVSNYDVIRFDIRDRDWVDISVRRPLVQRTTSHKTKVAGPQGNKCAVWNRAG